MSTLSTIGTPQHSHNASQSVNANATAVDTGQSTTSEDTLQVAKKFEALLIHNMLKAMRSTTLGDKPSNERAMYDDMFDQHLSKTLSESGGLGIANSISRQLNAQQGIEEQDVDSQLMQIKQSINALSNRPSTLAYNGQIASSAEFNSRTEALVNRPESVSSNILSSMGNIRPSNINSGTSEQATSKADAKVNFLNALMPDAKRAAARLGVEPEIVIAIAALETGWGQHMIRDAQGANSHNLFGIKAVSSNAPYTMHKTTEFIGNRPTTVDAAFRRYNSNSSAVSDFADFLLTNPRYEKALEASSDSRSFLQELQRAGYATDPQYATKAWETYKQVKSIHQGPAL